MTREQLAQELEFRARVARTIARSIRGDVEDLAATSGTDGRLCANAASLEHVSDTLRHVAHIIREEGLDR